MGQVELSHLEYVGPRKATAEASCEIVRELIDELLPISSPTAPALFFLDDPSPNLPVRSSDNRIDRSARASPCAFEEFDNSVVERPIPNCRQPLRFLNSHHCLAYTPAAKKLQSHKPDQTERGISGQRFQNGGAENFAARQISAERQSVHRPAHPRGLVPELFSSSFSTCQVGPDQRTKMIPVGPEELFRSRPELPFRSSPERLFRVVDVS
jgi:hypothetical protein